MEKEIKTVGELVDELLKYDREAPITVVTEGYSTTAEHKLLGVDSDPCDENGVVCLRTEFNDL